MLRLPIALLFVLVLSAAAHGQGQRLFVVDFEGFAEDTEIDVQYIPAGVVFSMLSDTDARPIIAVEGSPRRAFGGSGDDNPMSDGIAGLTDPPVGNDYTAADDDIVLDFDPPVTSVRLYIVDIDGSDVFTLRAFEGDTEVASDTKSAGDPGTGNARSTQFFVAGGAIDRVVVDAPEGDGVGYAVDFISFTRPCEGQDCGALIELAQESAPGAGDFNSNILGNLLAYPYNASAASLYAYNVPEGDSWNGLVLSPLPDRSHVLLAETTDGLTLVVVHDRAFPDDPDGGRAETRVEVFNDPDGLVRTVEDDPANNEAGPYIGEPGDSVFTAEQEWSTCCTDGYALSGLSGDWTALVGFSDTDNNANTLAIDGLTEWAAYSADGTVVPLALEEGRRIRMRLVPGQDCPADFNNDGIANTLDVLAFLNAWTNDDPRADYNDDGVINTLDVLAFLNVWAAGCA